MPRAPRRARATETPAWQRVPPRPWCRSSARAARAGSPLVSVFRVGLDDVPPQAMSHDVRLGEVMEGDPLDPGQDPLDLHQSGLLALRQVDLGLVARDDDLRVHAESR